MAALVPNAEAFVCALCSRSIPLQEGIPLFTAPPPELHPSEKYERGPEVGTPWRRANWRFLAAQLERFPHDALLLDVGAGRGDFASLYARQKCLALDIYPYPEVDLVCDLTLTNPFCAGSLDGILLMNVLEHVYATHTLLAVLADLLKPGGLLIIAIPFMVKLHQIPVDYVRYTHYSLANLARDYGFEVDLLEGYYDPVFFLEEGAGNIRWGVLPALKRRQRYLARPILAGITILGQGLNAILGPGQSISPATTRSQAPIGYQIVFRKASPKPSDS